MDLLTEMTGPFECCDQKFSAETRDGGSRRVEVLAFFPPFGSELIEEEYRPKCFFECFRL
jgi:hypothetical protein